MDIYEYNELLKELKIKIDNIEKIVKPEELKSRLDEIDRVQQEPNSGVMQKMRQRYLKRRDRRRGY